MTEPDSNPPGLTRAEEDAVRRHLASARHTEPIPDAVAERLDRVLTGLADERTTDAVGAPVIHLAARRRRRRGAQLLVAAAAVVIAGFGFGQLGGPGGEESSDSASSADVAVSADAAEGQTGGGGDAEPDDTERNANPRSSPTAAGELSPLPVIRPDHFRADVAHEVTQAKADTFAHAEGRARRPACPVPAKDGRALAVSYDGDLAALVFNAPTGHEQRVDLYRCDPEGTSGFVRSVVIPHP